MGDLKISEGFLDAIMIRVTATGAASLGLAPTCTVMKLSDGTTVNPAVAELTLGVYKATNWTPDTDTEYMTIWAVAGANTIYQAFKLFKVGGGVIADWENGGRLDLILDTLALEATLAVVDGIVDNIIIDTNEIQVSLADGGFTDLLIDSIIERTVNLPDDPADASDIADAHALLATVAKQDIIDGIVDDIKATLADGGFTDLLIDAIKTRTDLIQNSELFGSVMQEEVQLGAGAADVNMPNVDLPDIPGAIDRVYLHFKVRMIENTHDGVNELAGAQSIRIKKAAGAWGVDDISAITFLDGGIELAALTREAGDVFGGMIDVSSEVDAFNATYNIRWEDGAVDQDFINFNDIEMFLRVIFH